MATVFDTLTAARELEDAGLKREHAEAVAKVAGEAAEAGRNELATKADLYQALYKFAVGIVIANAGVAIAIVFALSKVLAAE